ncbi:MAG: HAMP domain-containing sensor histidine kinase [Candidatus Staskawiczbacteria bacterium]|nr:HAMP domain-containing sensor histidine kinase [Candidatus Staskawiczbacteria bacterium]
METNESLQTEKKLGDSGYVNKNCWLARNLGYPPSKHCQYCELQFTNCLFFRYLIVSSILVAALVLASFFVEGGISKVFIVSVFVLVITYGYFFDKSTQKIIESSFAQRKAKESFEELSRNLQQKVNEQTREITEAYVIEKNAKESLQKLDQQKNEFMMITQHHLRTPLTSMMGYVSLLQDGAYGKVPKKIGEVVARFGISSGKLIRIVNEFLDLSHFQMGEKIVKLESDVDVKAIVESVINELKIDADKKALTLEIEEPKEIIPKIQVDSDRLQVVLVNIIDNAIKYTQKGGVTVQLRNKTENSEQKLEIIVKDTGAGMNKSQLDNLFQNLFVRGTEAKIANITGMGIGMYLSSKIIKSHNGRIWAESDGKEKGSSFHIELPVKQLTTQAVGI